MTVAQKPTSVKPRRNKFPDMCDLCGRKSSRGELAEEWPPAATYAESGQCWRIMRCVDIDGCQERERELS
jgi:hypothetical protein